MRDANIRFVPNAVVIDGEKHFAKYRKVDDHIRVEFDDDYVDVYPSDEEFVPARLAAQYAAAHESEDRDQMKRLADALEYYYEGDGTKQPIKPRKPNPISVTCSILFSAFSSFFSYKQDTENAGQRQTANQAFAEKNAAMRQNRPDRPARRKPRR